MIFNHNKQSRYQFHYFEKVKANFGRYFWLTHSDYSGMTIFYLPKILAKMMVSTGYSKSHNSCVVTLKRGRGLISLKVVQIANPQHLQNTPPLILFQCKTCHEWDLSNTVYLCVFLTCRAAGSVIQLKGNFTDFRVWNTGESGNI